jgi:polyisoprenoid-binding protein YceI
MVVLTLIPALAIAQVPSAGAPVEYVIDTKASRVTIDVGKSGLFAFLGHTHEVVAPVANGAVQLDRENPSRSTVRLEFDARTLRVTGKGEPAEDVPEVQRTMQREVLEVSRFPRIIFASRDISVVEQTGGHLRLRIAGDLAVHGVTRRQTTDVVVNFDSERITATGNLILKQTEFGIERVSAGAGTVRVKDELEIHFRFVAVPAPSVGNEKSRVVVLPLPLQPLDLAKGTDA